MFSALGERDVAGEIDLVFGLVVAAAIACADLVLRNQRHRTFGVDMFDAVVGRRGGLSAALSLEKNDEARGLERRRPIA